jgi:hypothetical protein
MNNKLKNPIIHKQSRPRNDLIPHRKIKVGWPNFVDISPEIHKTGMTQMRIAM